MTRTTQQGTHRTQRNGKPAEAPPQKLSVGRVPPFDLDAECGVLGSIMLLSTCVDDVALLIKPEDFYDQAHAAIYGLMLAMHNKGRPIDVTLLMDDAKRQITPSGQTLFDSFGGAPYLAKILHAVSNAAHATFYAEIVAAKSTLRRLITAGTEILQDAYEPDAEPATLISQATAAIAAVSDSAVSGDETRSGSDLMRLALDELDDRLTNRTYRGLSTGYSKLDDMLRGGLKEETLTIVAGRPSMGKTSLALNIAANAADAMRVVYFQSLEMGATELGERLLCSEARVNSHRLAHGNISQEERERLVRKAGQIAEWKLFVDDTPSRTIPQIAAMARRLKRKHGLHLLVIDYLQLIEPDNPRDPRQEQVAKMSRRLKVLARELKIPIVCLAQLNRQAEATKDNKPKLSHLRESGAIEQDADVILFPFRPAYYETSENGGSSMGNEKAELIVAKQRNGPVGDAPVVWTGQFARFDNLAEQRHEDMF